MKTVWTMPPPGRDEKRFGKHPTQKPLALIQRCLRASTHPGEIVFDPFVGSGSTGVAALGLKRIFIGAEADQHYADIAVKRMSEMMDAPSENGIGSTPVSGDLTYERTPEPAKARLFEGSKS